MDGLNDPSLDREIESLLATEPSPEFVARVRARVASEPEPGKWRASWMFAMAGAVAVVIVAIAVWPSNEPAQLREEPAPIPQVARAVEVVPPQSVSPAPERVGRPARARSVAVASPERRIDLDLPEVLIADNEMKTFALLVARVRQSRFNVAVPAAPDPDKPLEIKELPPVEPLEIEPIVKLAALQAEGERP
jgi:hypothetical protein